MVTKVMVFMLMMAIVFVIMEACRFIFAYKTVGKFETSTTRTVLVITAIAYILTIIFTGLNF